MIKAWRDEKGGFILIFTTILMSFFLGMCAVVIDGGTSIFNKHIVVNAGDAAALAGTSAVEGKLVFDEFNNPIGQRPVLNPVIADSYAMGTLTTNIEVMKFNQRGISVDEVIGVSLDGDGDGNLDSYSIRLKGTVDAPLFGPILGLSERVPFDKTVVAKVNE